VRWVGGGVKGFNRQPWGGSSSRQQCTAVRMPGDNKTPQPTLCSNCGTCCEVLQDDPGVHHCQRRRHACVAPAGRSGSTPQRADPHTQQCRRVPQGPGTVSLRCLLEEIEAGNKLPGTPRFAGE
jgi:hypothetical protein